MANEITEVEPPVFDESSDEVVATESTDDAAQTSTEETWAPKDHFNIEEYPEDMRERLAPVITKMKQDWDKKSRTASDFEKSNTELTTNMTQLQEMARAVLQDTTNGTLNQYRRQYGLSVDEPTTKDSTSNMPSIPEIDWSLVTDQASFGKVFGASMQQYQSEMADYVKGIATAVADEVRRDSEYKFQQLASPIKETEWKNAFKTLKDKYGDSFSEVERDIAQSISRGAYQGMYGKMDNTELIDVVFKSKYADKYHDYLKAQEIAKAETKANASTEKARKSSKMKYAKDDMSDDAIVARVIEKHGTEQ